MGKHRKRDTDSDSDDESPSSASPSSSSSYSSDESDSSSRRRRKKRRKNDGSYEREKRRKREKEKKRKKMERKRRDKKKRSSKKRGYESDTESESGSDSMSDQPETVVKEMLIEFPNVANDLKQLLRMIDAGQAVDIKGISESVLKKRLKKLFLSLKLKERGDRVFLLPPGASPSLDMVGHLIKGDEEEEEVEKSVDDSAPLKNAEAATSGNDEANLDDVAGPKKR